MTGSEEMTGTVSDPWAVRGRDSVLCRCRRGDEKAWQLVWGYVVAVCRSAVRGKSLSAEDIAGDLVLRLVKSGMRGVESEAALKSFLYRSVCNAVIDVRRSRWRELLTGEPETVSTVSIPSDSVDQPTINRETREIIGEILEDLTKTCCEVLRAYFSYKAGWIESYAALARLLGRPVGTVSAQVTRCMRKFRGDPRLEELR